MDNWTDAEYARWERACGISEEEIKRRADERKAKRKLAAAAVNPYEHTCDYCGCKFGAKFSYKYCGRYDGCLKDETGATKAEMQKILDKLPKT